MYAMFYGATNFDQDLSRWDFSGLDDRYPQWALAYAFGYSGMDTDNYDDLLIRLREQADDLPTNINLGARELTYCAGGTARSELLSTYNWTVTDAGLATNCLFQPGGTDQLSEATPAAATEEILLYPNPTGEVLTILFNPAKGYERVTITDALGRQIFAQPLHDEQHLLTIPVANERFAAGVYQVTLEGEQTSITRQVVVQR
jgi:hypothetical protein